MERVTGDLTSAKRTVCLFYFIKIQLTKRCSANKEKEEEKAKDTGSMTIGMRRTLFSCVRVCVSLHFASVT